MIMISKIMLLKIMQINMTQSVAIKGDINMVYQIRLTHAINKCILLFS